MSSQPREQPTVEWFASCHDCDRWMWYPDEERATNAAEQHEREYGHTAYADSKEVDW